MDQRRDATVGGPGDTSNMSSKAASSDQCICATHMGMRDPDPGCGADHDDLDPRLRRERDIRAAAWDEGWNAGFSAATTGAYDMFGDNPYRKGGGL